MHLIFKHMHHKIKILSMHAHHALHNYPGPSSWFPQYLTRVHLTIWSVSCERLLFLTYVLTKTSLINGNKFKMQGSQIYKKPPVWSSSMEISGGGGNSISFALMYLYRKMKDVSLDGACFSIHRFVRTKCKTFSSHPRTE